LNDGLGLPPRRNCSDTTQCNERPSLSPMRDDASETERSALPRIHNWTDATPLANAAGHERHGAGQAKRPFHWLTPTTATWVARAPAQSQLQCVSLTWRRASRQSASSPPRPSQRSPTLLVPHRQPDSWPAAHGHALTAMRACTANLTFELSGGRRCDDWPARLMISRTASRARRRAVGSPLERGVRLHPGSRERRTA
jgi:hypothetical protein